MLPSAALCIKYRLGYTICICYVCIYFIICSFFQICPLGARWTRWRCQAWELHFVLILSQRENNNNNNNNKRRQKQTQNKLRYNEVTCVCTGTRGNREDNNNVGVTPTATATLTSTATATRLHLNAGRSRARHCACRASERAWGHRKTTKPTSDAGSDASRRRRRILSQVFSHGGWRGLKNVWMEKPKEAWEESKNKKERRVQRQLAMCLAKAGQRRRRRWPRMWMQWKTNIKIDESTQHTAHTNGYWPI